MALSLVLDGGVLLLAFVVWVLLGYAIARWEGR